MLQAVQGIPYRGKYAIFQGKNEVFSRQGLGFLEAGG
jgi:hypothetical protein